MASSTISGQSGELSSRSMVFLRAFSRHVPHRADFLQFVEGCCLHAPQMERAAAYLDDTRFRAMSKEGADALKRLERAYAAALRTQNDTVDVFGPVQNVCDDVAAMVRSSQAVAREPFGKEPDILPVDQCSSYERFYTDYVLAFCRYIAVFYGAEHLRPLRGFSFSGGSFDRDDLKFRCDTVLGRVGQLKPKGTWLIVRTDEVGDGFQYRTRGSELTVPFAPLRQILSAGNFARLSYNVFANRDASSPVIAAGFGNIVGTSLKSSYRLCAENVHTMLPVDAFDPSQSLSANPLTAVQGYFQDDAYCVSPEAFASALDRYLRCRSYAEAGGAQAPKRCIRCGAPAVAGGFCREHSPKRKRRRW